MAASTSSGGHDLQRVATVERFNQAAGDVEIGRKVAGVRQDHAPRRIEFERRGQRLVDLDGQRIAHHHRPVGGADQPADAVADTARLRHPPGDVPALDEVLAPFLRYHAADAIGGCNGQGTERIAVQIDQAIRDGEQGFCSREIGHVFPWLARPAGIIRADINYFKLKIYGRKARFSV